MDMQARYQETGPSRPKYSLSPQDFYVPFPADDVGAGDARYSTLSAEHARPRKSSRSSARPASRPSERPSSSASSYSPSLYAPPVKPLPPLPPSRRSNRAPSHESFDQLSLDARHLSISSDANSSVELNSLRSSFPKPPSSHRTSTATRDYELRSPISPTSMRRTSDFKARAVEHRESGNARITMSAYKSFVPEKKKKNNCVHYMDLSSGSSILASKHGNNYVRVWSTENGEELSMIKFSSYTEPQSRSREYLIRSHACLSETASLIAIATRFGRSVEVYNWTTKKSLQSIDNADRWTANRFGLNDTGCSAIAAYQNANNTIQVWMYVQDKKPFALSHTVDLLKADLPFLMQYPEVALSPTSPMLVAAAGPRPPRPGHPPPDNETLLVAWAITDIDDLSTPHMMTRPSLQHPQLETAIPCELATYGSVVVSIWIPASYKAVAAPKDTKGWVLTPVAVAFRHVIVWDLASNSTRTFRIPDTTSCVSPDCRFVAYCAASTTNMGGRGYLAILDVITGKEVWCFPDPEATAMDSGPKAGFEQFNALSKVTELRFSNDGGFLVVGDSDGQCCMYQLNELAEVA